MYILKNLNYLLYNFNIIWYFIIETKHKHITTNSCIYLGLEKLVFWYISYGNPGNRIRS